jgi:4-amino-4-deoxy-L-arabinose transferase-like glycosyltransferase
MGHLLTWDEAMNICSARSLFSLGNDHFSNWFWRHPPLYSTLTLALSPLREGFITRVELLNIVLGAINLFLLFILNKKFFGLIIASASVFLLSIMPGSIFFDLWIKRDHLAVTCGLLALYSLANRKYAFSALAAGLGILCKETFVFLYVPIFLLTVMERSNKPSRPVRIALITVIPLLTSFWWFIIASRQGSLSSIGNHFQFAFASNTTWYGGLDFYPSLTGELLGPAGILLLIGGILVAIICVRKFGAKVLAWPLLFLLLPLIFLAVIPRKVPWIVIVFLPGLATAQALAAGALLERITAPRNSRFIAIAASVIGASLLALPAFNHSHE